MPFITILKDKSCDTFTRIGPFLVTSDEIPDPQNLKLWLKLNGKAIQNSTTAQMIFGVKHLVNCLSQFMSLLPGDVIELDVECLGEQGQKAVACA